LALVPNPEVNSISDFFSLAAQGQTPGDRSYVMVTGKKVASKRGENVGNYLRSINALVRPF